MADMTRGERTVQLFAKVISNPGKKFTVTDLMNTFNIPDEERRSVQRDIRFLSEMDGGRYITVENEGRTSVYRSALPNAERLLFPNFENTMLHFVFLKRIANIYPATSEIITQLLERIENSLPDSERKSLRQLAEALNTRILFMGTPPDFEENSSEKIRIILQAIHDHRKIEVTYRDSGNSIKESVRIPLMIIIYEDELYVGCQRPDGKTYTLKFRRIKKVKLSKEMYAEDPKVLDRLRRLVTSDAAFLSGQEPKLQDVEIEFQGHARVYLEENPFNRSMQIGKTKDGKFTVKLKAEVNQMLFNWVVSFSNVARVVKPVSLRKWLRDYAEYLMENYGD